MTEVPISLTGEHCSALARKDWEGLTIEDINQLAREGKLPGYEGIVFDEGFFYDDPAIAQAIRDSNITVQWLLNNLLILLLILLRLCYTS